MFAIEQLIARELLDACGRPTLEVDCLLDGGASGRALVGAEPERRDPRVPPERRDGGLRHLGQGMQQAAEGIRTEIQPAIVGMDAREQVLLDRTLLEINGTLEPKHLGVQALLSVSLAAARAAAEATSLPLYHYLGGPMATLLPVPLVTLFDGSEGLGGPRADLRTLYLVPYGFDHFRDALRACCEIHHVLGDLMQQRGQIALVTAGGGYRAPTPSAVALFDLAQQAIDGAGYDPSEQIGLGIDVGADDLVTGNNGHGVRYTLPSDADGPGGGGEDLGAEALTDRYRAWHGSAPLVSIEDGLAHTDVEGWRHLSDELSDELQLVGGDLFVSSAPNLADGIADAVANAFLVRPVQVGTLSEMLKAIEMAKINAYATLFAHASGETDDSALADLSVATQAGQARLGGVGRGEAIVKYNRLLRIEQELAQAAVYPGPSAFPRRDA